jgi:phosphoribosylanthranilate isomerase
MRVRVKICGITRPADAEVAARAGADAVGLVFHPPSSRCVDIAAAREIAAAVGPFVSTVALFVNPTREVVEAVVSGMRPDLLQFHGDEPASFCERFGVPYLKSLPVGVRALEVADLAVHPAARALLLDTLDPQRHGGTGRSFDWSLVPGHRSRPLILAGGLDAANVTAAIGALRPWAVDVSSGVESAPGRKDPGKIEDFMRAVARANAAVDRPSPGADVE